MDAKIYSKVRASLCVTSMIRIYLVKPDLGTFS